MVVSDLTLARRLSRIIVDEMVAFVGTARRLYPDTGAEVRRIGAGAAMCGADAIPFSEATGFGLDGPADDKILDAIKEFFSERGCHAKVDVCSLADSSVALGLARRGFVPGGFEDVLGIELSELTPDPAKETADVRIVPESERDSWGDLMTEGFAEGAEPSDVERRFGRIVAAREGTHLVWAWSEGRPVATGELAVIGDIAWLSADTTLESHRGQGFQQSLQRLRLALARDAGCRLAISEAVPGGVSHRNMERAGFRVLFTHLAMVCGRSAS